MVKMGKDRVKHLIKLHNPDYSELIQGSYIGIDEFEKWINDEIDISLHNKTIIFNNAKEIDLEEREKVRDGMSNLGFANKTAIAKHLNVSHGHFRMWLNGERNIPFEEEQRAYLIYDSLKEAVESALQGLTNS